MKKPDDKARLKHMLDASEDMIERGKLKWH